MTKTVLVKARGLTPLLMHKVLENSRRREMVELSKGELASLLFFDPEGRLVFPSKWLHQSLHIAHASRCFGKGPTKEIIKRKVRILPDLILLTDSAGGMPRYSEYLHPRHLSKGGRVGSIRCPEFDDWGFRAEIIFDESLDIASLQRTFGEAGRAVGLGLFSPFYGGKNSFGRFEAVEWEWKEDSATHGQFSISVAANILGVAVIGSARLDTP